ncbi:MAG: ribonuclease P protein component [Deltaproteobacteria bacterium]|nr:ribonuclease P protein component [Deltaproteobacteria bacterium]
MPYEKPDFFLKKGGRGSRLGIIVTKRFGKAARRNRAKRIIREVWRRNSPYFSPPCEAVIVVKNDAGVFNLEDCRDDFRNAFERYGKSRAENS